MEDAMIEIHVFNEFYGWVYLFNVIFSAVRIVSWLAGIRFDVISGDNVSTCACN